MNNHRNSKHYSPVQIYPSSASRHALCRGSHSRSRRSRCRRTASTPQGHRSRSRQLVPSHTHSTRYRPCRWRYGRCQPSPCRPSHMNCCPRRCTAIPPPIDNPRSPHRRSRGHPCKHLLVRKFLQDHQAMPYNLYRHHRPNANQSRCCNKWNCKHYNQKRLPHYRSHSHQQVYSFARYCQQYYHHLLHDLLAPDSSQELHEQPPLHYHKRNNLPVECN